MSGPEWTLVEKPLIDQLVGLGWTHIVGSTTDPAATGRSSFREVLLDGHLRDALRRINLDDAGQPWLDDARLSQATSALGKVGATAKLVEANQAGSELLLKGTTVAGVQGWDGGRDRTVHYLDWEHPERNDFVVVNQFRVDEPGGQAKRYALPDLVLFVNGIPLVVVEAKAPGPEAAMAEAIRQLRRYANQRSEVRADEGVEELFWSNQLVVATTNHEARIGTFTSGPEHFLEWKDPAPLSRDDVAARLGKPVGALSSQEVLVAGVLDPARLLDIVRHFTLFMPAGPRLVKVVARYQQYRGVHRALDRLQTGRIRAEDGVADGGVA
jgi:type I restriction enzyme, R subunit